jgi:hypothetical protein
MWLLIVVPVLVPVVLRMVWIMFMVIERSVKASRACKMLVIVVVVASFS